MPLNTGGVDEFGDQSQWIVGEFRTTLGERCRRVFFTSVFVVVVEGWNAMGSWWNPWDIACMNGIFTDPWMVDLLIC